MGGQRTAKTTVPLEPRLPGQQAAGNSEPKVSVRQYEMRMGDIAKEMDQICPRLVNFAGDLGFASLTGAPLHSLKPGEQQRILRQVVDTAGRMRAALPPAESFAVPQNHESLAATLSFIESEARAQLEEVIRNNTAGDSGSGRLSPTATLKPPSR